jgi:hypothetical protein
MAYSLTQWKPGIPHIQQKKVLSLKKDGEGIGKILYWIQPVSRGLHRRTYRCPGTTCQYFKILFLRPFPIRNVISIWYLKCSMYKQAWT